MSNQIRNFSIIAHIDHGKTTLTDRFLRLTNTVLERDFSERMMDSNPIEQERGITIKLAPVRMKYHDAELNQDFILNLIDTPGHVDFGYEVSRSLAACEGVILLVDVSQGVQAQTLANYQKAKELGLVIIPVLNKVDLPTADVEAATLEVMEAFGVTESEIVSVSAKTGLNLTALLTAVINRIPPPQGDVNRPLRALIFTSQFDHHRGVIAYIRVIDGVLKREQLHLIRTQTDFAPLEIGVFTPQMTPVAELKAGEVGYVSTGLKEVAKIKVGDTLTTTNSAIEPLAGYKEPTPMVYMQFYPLDGDDFMLLQDAVSKLALHDSSLVATGVHSVALGNGLRIGFLGLLHADIIRERLEREFDLDLIATTPTVPYQIITTRGEELSIHSPNEMPDPSLIKIIKEPMTKSTIITPKKYVSAIIKLSREHRGELIQTENKGERTQLTYYLPLSEIIISFHDQLKSVSSGYASLEYEVTDYAPVDALKLDIVVHGEPIEALSQIVIKSEALRIGRVITKKLKEVLPRQMFEVPIQATIGGNIVARETIKAFRKDVTAKLYGGDVTRRMKLLRKQARGKKKMKKIGKVEINQEAFLAVLER